MSDELVLYTNPMSRGRVARWMLEEVAVPYETHWLEYGTTMKAPEYLAINPMGKVPAIRHGQAVITEVSAICAYLADAFPAAGLAPEPDQRADYYRWLFFTAGPLEYAITNHSLGVEAPSDKQGMIGYGSYEAALDCVEQMLNSRDYVTGKQFSAADVYLGSQIGFGLTFGSLEKRPAFERYFERLSGRDAHKRAAEIDDARLSG